jgi:hypothetical protein
MNIEYYQKVLTQLGVENEKERLGDRDQLKEELLALVVHCKQEYMSKHLKYKEWFNDKEIELLKEWGMTQQELFDFIEDHCNALGEEPTLNTIFEVAWVRRAYFILEQNRQGTGKILDRLDMPGKQAEFRHITWLPRIHFKALKKLAGELDDDTMFGCGGDRLFLKQHYFSAADFLCLVWLSKNDIENVFQGIKSRH